MDSPETTTRTGAGGATRAVRVGSVTIGGGPFVVIAGPCAVESKDLFLETARAVRASGASLLRGGIFKLRTAPSSFQGLGREGLEEIRAVKEELGLPLVTEVTDPRHLESMLPVVDMLQVGSRNMFNYPLLSEAGKTGKPILLKRGFSARLEEWVLAAEYILKEGNEDVVLCERGIRTFETATRNTLDLASAAWIKARFPFPVIVDPSHATGLRELVEPMALAAAAAGTDGLLVEVHPRPDRALSDGRQSLDLEGFRRLTERLRSLLSALDRPLHEAP